MSVEKCLDASNFVQMWINYGTYMLAIWGKQQIINKTDIDCFMYE